MIKEGRTVQQAARPTSTAVKILVAGALAVGKTTLVASVSEIRPLTTEEKLTVASAATDDLTGVESKATTTVAFDFGRITFGGPDDLLTLYVFGTPGQERFTYLWDGLAAGAIGAVVLADTRRLEDSFACLDYFEARRLPFIVAVNEFDGADRYHVDEVRDALELKPRVPVVLCDARSRTSATATLSALVRHALHSLPHAAPSPLGAPA
ncbi:Signal recognition particle receptor subunit beta, a GTPase [Actinacidiphila alni]|uniref:Signal recognition particle receptor subunit beta, a GTPase n=1 Tax=Actinacidiphila alni TaxID=380248 RepID=A0A1I2L990_9ACTN|nr:ATP/GTP-binding protein [Actinacidiphila alni]SFF75108.1 Signal recognition particle receptor subunit beta, a GTPase [Actinacidiphila alni]